MSENLSITPLNWKAVVGEALRRRRAEKMTQREHAALANVSVPTMAAFERGDTSLSLTKAFDILRIVGLVNEPSEGGLQDAFVRESFARWQELKKKEPNLPIQFPYGWVRFDYYLEGDLKHVNLKEFDKILNKVITYNSGWPPFYFSTVNPLHETDGVFERYSTRCEDFWRADPDGRMFLIRNYQEDTEETFPPQIIFDITLPIWRMSEVLLHAERLATLLKKNENTPITIHFQALYSGLNGRILRSWAMPDTISNISIEGRAARGDEVLLKSEFSAHGVSEQLAEHLYPLVSNLYQKFGITDFPKDLVEDVVKRLFKYKKPINYRE